MSIPKDNLLFPTNDHLQEECKKLAKVDNLLINTRAVSPTIKLDCHKLFNANAIIFKSWHTLVGHHH